VLTLVGLSIILFLISKAIVSTRKTISPVPKNFEECASLPGSKILESYPEVCVTAGSQRFVRELSEEEQQNLRPPTLSPSANRDVGEGCMIGGCNSEICQNEGEEPAVSICIYDPRYECYNTAICEKQANGNCAWTETEELTTCLSEFE
jgi:hypothetical protein